MWPGKESNQLILPLSLVLYAVSFPLFFNGRKVLYLARLMKAFPSIFLNVRRIVILSTLSSTSSTIRFFAAVIYYIVLFGLL